MLAELNVINSEEILQKGETTHARYYVTLSITDKHTNASQCVSVTVKSVLV